jgi:two-component system, NtrC family, response regulator GlrR
MYKILIVDDDYSLRLLYQMELEDEGYSVTTTSDCSRLFELIEDVRPDLILMDVRLEEMNGSDLLKQIREIYCDIPVILCSAFELLRYDIKAIAADYFVKKGVDLSELKSTVKIAFENLKEGETGLCFPVSQMA